MYSIDLNLYGISLLDIYYINYYGITVFFEVCSTEDEYVCVCELKKKTVRIGSQEYEALANTLECSKSPLIVPKSTNTFTKSKYRVMPEIVNGDVVLPIEINYSSELYKEASKYNECPIVGTVYAERLYDYYGLCWEKPFKYIKNKNKTFLS